MIVVFTSKYECKINKEVSVNGNKFPSAEGVEYLGVFLDKRLR